jgi:hypothetical protein
MKIKISQMNALLIQEDIEGFIEMGAPTKDEYVDEATQIAAALSHMKAQDVTKENVTSVVTSWAFI